MHNFFVKNIVDKNVTFFDDDLNHIKKVLRLKEDDLIKVNFQNQKFIAKITRLIPLSAIVIKQIDIDIKNNFNLDVFCASIKPNHMELAIIKATELNVNRFFIFKSEYSQNNINHNLERYYKIMLNAAKQSNRVDLMEIIFINNIELVNKELSKNDLLILANFNGSRIGQEVINSYCKNIAIMVGPEGGFSENDLNQIKHENKYIMNLTKTILRTETALLYLVSVISYLMING